MKIKTPSDLKYAHEAANPKTYFFSRDTMEFFGDRMSNYGLRSVTINGIDYYELYRKKPVNGGLQNSHFFRKSDVARHTTNPALDLN